ncbi:SAM-dependent methyltransferase [Plantactinospora sonchi]|uniref:Class I SAM-dependent methyltransferase n=1 Tax=Plantactinospora sonchi TaxID=1544735 RepID=A0ABU7RU66_9ACTN
MDLPRSFVIREHNHRIHNPLTEAKLATLGRAIRLRPGTTILDLACGSGEMLCTWARDHGVVGTGVDISTVFVAAAQDRAAALDVTDQVTFVHGDAAGHVAPTAVDVAACLGATWIGDGVAGTVDLLGRSLRPNGTLLVGEPFWRAEPPDHATVEGCHARTRDDYHDLPGLVGLFTALGYDLVEMVLADEDSWDRYVAAQWITIRAWLDANPDDPLTADFRAELDTAPQRYVRYLRPHLGWGAFALRRR